MPPLRFSNEEMESITALASALPPATRGEFLQLVAAKLSEHPAEVRGVGLVHRLAAEVQRDFLRGGLLAVGVARSGKYGRSPRRERRRR